jgi:type II secretory pathway component GspD/PulD (secretin)
VINALRNTVSTQLQNAEVLAAPDPAVPPLPVPAGPTHVIPFAQPADEGEVTVEHQEDLVSLMVRDASLRQVIALVAETQKLNIVFATPADVRVTAAFDRVPWQQVVDALLSASGHTWTTNQGVIFVTSLETADFVLPGVGGRETRVIELDFASSVDVDQAVKGILSPAGKSWILESSPTDNRRTREAVVVIDYPANLARVEEYVCQIDQPPRQVLIEANILQIELQDDCRSGVNFEEIARLSGNELNFRSVGFANAAASPAFFLEATGGALTGLVELLKTTTDAKTLASPKLLAVNGQEAHIQIGEQLGFRVTTTTQTSSLESVQFLNVGVVLTVTPRITRDGRVLMRIKPKVSTGEVSPDTGLPSEKTTEVETDVIVESGRGVVIGGLIQERDSNIQTKVPWLGDIPYAGILFQRRQVVKSRAEIIVTLIPHVQPYAPLIEERDQHEFMRTQDRLTVGPLCRVPRPYEPRLPDTFTNPKWLCQPRECRPTPVGPYAQNGPQPVPATLQPMFEAPPFAPQGNPPQPFAPGIPFEQARQHAPLFR